jgi:hypothetical protein
MSISRPLALAIGGAGIAGLALIGVGAGATFTDSTASHQTITAGHLNVVVSSADSSVCPTAASGCKELTLAPVGPVGSSFETPATIVTATNVGDIPATFDAIQMTETDNGTNESAALKNQMNVCIMSHDPSGTWVEGNGPLATALALNPTVKENGVVLAPGASFTYAVSFYAGQNSRAYTGDTDGLASQGCGQITSSGPNTTAAWDAYDGGTYHTPASLTNAAEGGSVTPTLNFSFTG